jgi:hypothetical protein
VTAAAVGPAPPPRFATNPRRCWCRRAGDPLRPGRPASPGPHKGLLPGGHTGKSRPAGSKGPVRNRQSSAWMAARTPFRRRLPLRPRMPSSRTALTRCGPLTRAVTLPPPAWASWTAKCPTPPDAPVIRTRRPSRGASDCSALRAVRAVRAVSPATGSAAAGAKDTVSGMGATRWVATDYATHALSMPNDVFPPCNSNI